MKEFNTTGICIPEKHYMADTSKVIVHIIDELVDKGKYFTINRARQYGKTTTLNLLSQKLREKYLIIQLSFEATDDYFVSLYQFVSGIVLDIADVLEREQVDTDILNNWSASISENLPLRQLGKKITKLCESADRPVILIIDEVDKSSDNQIFLSFLGMLRDKYLKSGVGQDTTFKSVILSSVYDIKNMKLKLSSHQEHKYNSPWNIAADFTADMSINANQIEKMLTEYSDDYEIDIDTKWFASHIFDYTSGYPFLVSLFCKTLHEHDDWTREGFQRAVKKIVTGRSTLFDDINKNIDIYPMLGELLKGILLHGKSYAYTLSDDTVQIGVMFGYIHNNDGCVAISNRMFEMYLYDMYYKANEINSALASESSQEKNQYIKAGVLDMNYILERFAVHYRNLYQDNQINFLEEQCRFLFLTFLKPIINGTGNYYIEAQTRNQRRMDIVIDYLGNQYIVELKVWHGEKYQEDGRQQLADYLEYMEAEKGWLITFNFLKTKKEVAEIKESIVDDKHIFEIVV